MTVLIDHSENRMSGILDPWDDRAGRSDATATDAVVGVTAVGPAPSPWATEDTPFRYELRSSYLATVQMLADAMAARDASLRGHCNEVADYAGAVADRMGLDPREREEVVFGSLLHDVGKIGVSDGILLKPGPLSDEEFDVVKLHPLMGHRIVKRVPLLDPIALGILHHHERFDGTGYPSGLRGKHIPREARIIAVADAFSAMVSDRPYRRRMSLGEACAELERGSGTQFDPEIVRLFLDEVCRGALHNEVSAAS